MTPSPPLLRIALSGAVLLAAGMGLGRFLYTPVLPMMAAATGLSPGEAGLIAAANFLGYLLGALGLGLGTPLGPRALAVTALGVSAVSTWAMALTADPLAWAGLRLVGGLASAGVMVGGSSLVLGHLAARPGLGAVHFAGVGFGILMGVAISGPWVAGPQDWAAVYEAGGVLTLAACALVAWALPRSPAPMVAAAGGPGGGGLGYWIAAYACLGFGYVITATFLVAILRESAAGRGAESAVWALVGLAAMPSVWLWRRVAGRIGYLRAYQATLAVMAVGIACGVLAPGWPGWSAAAVALGLTFVAATALGLREAIRITGGDGRRAVGLMTAAFGVGQMLGPFVAGGLRGATGSYALPSLIAVGVLALGAVLLQPLARRGG